MSPKRLHVGAGILVIAMLALGCGAAATPAAEVAQAGPAPAPAPAPAPVEAQQPPVDVDVPEPEPIDAEGAFLLHIDRDVSEPERIVVALEWTGPTVLRMTRLSKSAHCGMADWRVTLTAADGSTYLSTPLSPRLLCMQVIIPEHTYEFEPDSPVVVASFRTRHLIPHDGVGPLAAGHYEALLEGTFAAANFVSLRGSVVL